MNPGEGFGFEHGAGGCSRRDMRKTLAAILDERKPRLGSTYQNGVRPGPRKLAQFRECLRLAEVPPIGSQEGAPDAIVHVKLFDPVGSWTWYVTEWDGENTAFGLVCGLVPEFGYIDISELAALQGGFGIGIELDMHFVPTPLSAVRSTPPFVA